MRTKNLNLKKKIAFIASVAMIATTAAYLPAEVTQNIFNSSITVEAAAGFINFAKAYVKVNGKFLAVYNGESKYYNTMAAYESADATTRGDLVELDVTKVGAAATDEFTVDGANAATKKGYIKNAGDDYNGADVDAYVMGKAVNGTNGTVVLPANTPANATITVAFVLDKTNTKLAFDGDSEVSVDLNDKGEAVIRKKKTVTIIGDDVMLDSKNKYKSGEIEYFNLKGLKFTVDQAAANGNNLIAAATAATNAAAGKDGFSIGRSTGNTIALAAAAGVEKVNVNGTDVYATVLEGAINMTANQYGIGVDDGGFASYETVKQGTTIKATLQRPAGFKVSGDPTFSIDKTGVAKSSVITKESNDGKTKEYYIIKLTVTDPYEADVKANTYIYQKDTAFAANDGGYNATNAKKLSTLNAGAGMKVFTTLEANKDGEFEEVVYVYTTASTANSKLYYKVTGDADAAGNNKYVMTSDGTITNANKDNKAEIAKESSGTEIDTLKLLKYDAGGANPVAIPVKFVISNEYKIPVEYNIEDDNIYADLYDTTVSSGTGFRGWELKNADAETTVTADKPDRPTVTPTKPGYTFNGWAKESTGAYTYNGKKLLDPTGTQAFGATSDKSATTVTPYDILVAKWKSNKFKLVLDGNGGFFGTPAAYGGTDWDVDKTDIDDKSIKISVDTNSADEVDTRSANVGPDAALAVADADRYGYDFKGWALKADATEAETLDAEAFEKAMPSEENGTLTLYAVWEANENTVTFNILDPTSTIATPDTYFSATPANVNTSTVKVATGSKITSLPKATKAGYTFAGWYRKVKNANGKYSISPVTTDTTIDYKFLDNAWNGSTEVAGATAMTLYAKFELNSYKITYDLAGGEWKDKTTEKAAPKSFDSSVDDANTDWDILNNILGTADAPAAAIAGAVENAPKKGTGEYYAFTGWIINGVKSKKYTTAEDLAKALVKADGDVTLTATYEVKDNVTGGSIYLDLDDGEYWAVDEDGKFWNTGLNEEPLIKGDSNAKLAEEIKGDRIFDTKGGANGTVALQQKDYIVVKPGYEFTGWYSDAECTKPYTFSNYPNETEITVYAGWKALNTTRYTLTYSLVDEDGSLVNIITGNDPQGNPIEGSEGSKTYMGQTGAIATATDKTITYKGVKYVYDAVRSRGLKTEEEITAGFVDKDAAHAVSAFEYDKNKYANVYGVYAVEGQQAVDPTKELGTATDVKVAEDGTVTFKAAANAKKYQVAKIVGSKTYYSAKTEDTTIKITPTKADYKVYVIAFNEDGTQSTHSVVVTGKGTGSQVALGTVMDPVATEKLEADGTKTVTITWSKAENAAWYKVFKIVNGKKYWGSKVTENSYVLKNIPATDSYIVYVAAGDGKGHVTYGARKKVSKFPSVTNVTVAPDNKTVTFDAVEGATGYQIAKIEANNKVNYSAKSTNPSITLKNAFKAGQKYYVLAFFTDADGKTKSSYSDTFEVK